MCEWERERDLGETNTEKEMGGWGYVGGGKKGKGNERRIKNRKGKTKLVLFVSLFYWVESVEL